MNTLIQQTHISLIQLYFFLSEVKGSGKRDSWRMAGCFSCCWREKAGREFLENREKLVIKARSEEMGCERVGWRRFKENRSEKEALGFVRDRATWESSGSVAGEKSDEAEGSREDLEKRLRKMHGNVFPVTRGGAKRVKARALRIL